MKVRVQLSRPGEDAPADRRRLRVLLEELPKLGVSCDEYRGGTDFDVLVLGQTQEYGRWLPILRSLRKAGRTVVHDVTNDVFSGGASTATRAQWGRWARPRAAWWGLRGRLQWAVRIGNWGRAPAFWRSCDAIVTGSALQADRYRPFCPNRHAIVDAVVPREYSARVGRRSHEPLRLGWEGTQDNLVNLRPFAAAWKELRETGVARLRVIADRNRSTPIGGTRSNEELLHAWGIDADFREWTPGTFANDLASTDIGIAPLPAADPFSASKPANKILGMAFLELPVVCSPIEAYRRELAAAKAPFGLLASGPSDWIEQVRALADDPGRRRALGAAGRRHVLTTAMPEHFARRYLGVLRTLRPGR